MKNKNDSSQPWGRSFLPPSHIFPCRSEVLNTKSRHSSPQPVFTLRKTVLGIVSLVWGSGTLESVESYCYSSLPPLKNFTHLNAWSWGLPGREWAVLKCGIILLAINCWEIASNLLGCPPLWARRPKAGRVQIWPGTPAGSNPRAKSRALPLSLVALLPNSELSAYK